MEHNLSEEYLNLFNSINSLAVFINNKGSVLWCNKLFKDTFNSSDNKDQIATEFINSLQSQQNTFGTAHSLSPNESFDVCWNKSPFSESIYLLCGEIQKKTMSSNTSIRYKAIFKHSPLGMILYNDEGQSIHINSAFKKMIDVEDNSADNIMDLYKDPNIPTEYKKDLKKHKLVSFEGPADYLFLHPSPDPNEISFKIFNYTISPIGTENSEFSGFVAIISDFTERRLHDQEIINTREQALEADMLKSAFLANMSHEIRTPMNAILGFSELLEYDGYSPEDRSLFIRTINDNGKYLLNLINDIIDFSKIEANQLNLNQESFCLNQLITDIYELMNSLAPFGVSFKISTQPSINEAKLTSDPNRIRQVFINLINNAFKFTKKGHVKIGYTLNTEKSEIICFVEDTGTGIPKDKQLHIFQRFSQIVDVQKGAGLGLAISQGIIELLGGRIWLESEQGIGTTFYFTLPYNRT